jgi:hypothetical protein
MLLICATMASKTKIQSDAATTAEFADKPTLSVPLFEL